MNYGKEYNLFLTVSSVQLLNCVWLFVTQRTAASQVSCPSPTPRANSNSCLSSQWHRPTISSSVVSFSSCPQSFATSESFQMSQFFYIRWPKYWSFNFSICPSNEYSGLMFFMIVWLDLLAVEGTLKSLLQHHSSKASILWSSTFCMVQISHLHMTTVKFIALTTRTFVGKLMSLLFNMLSSLVIAFLPTRQVSFNFMAAFTICSDFGAPQNKVCYSFHCFPIYLPWSNGTGCPNLRFLNFEFKPGFSLSSFTFIKRLFSFS